MFYKIFVNVLFEKKKFLIFFIVILSFLLYFIGVQTMVQFSQLGKTNIPDLVIYGKYDADGNVRFKGYNDMAGISRELSELCGDEAKVYEVTSRNLYFKTNFFNKIYYEVMGVDSNFFKDRLASHLRSGKLPEPGKREAVVGSLAAQEYNLNIGDKIIAPITLSKEISAEEVENNRYTVCGILDDSDEYFWGGIFISKEDYEKSQGNINIPENRVFVYYKTAASEKQVFDAYNKLGSSYAVGGTVSNTDRKDVSVNFIALNLLVISLISFAVIFLLLSFLMKGITKKLGLLKSLGLSDSYIVKNFVGGLFFSSILSLVLASAGILLTRNYLNKSISSFLGHSVKRYFINPYCVGSVLALWLVLVSSVFFIIKIKNWSISPRSAMMSQ